MAYRLAARCGVWDVERWRREELDPRQLDLWLAYSQLEPIGNEAEKMAAAMLALIAKVLGVDVKAEHVEKVLGLDLTGDDADDGATLKAKFEHSFGLIRAAYARNQKQCQPPAT